MYHMYSAQWIETLQGDQLLKWDVIKKNVSGKEGVRI